MNNASTILAKDLLTDRQVRNAKPKDREYLLSDGSGLHLRVRPSGAKDWMYIYSFCGKRRKLGLGSLDSVSLALARREADKARSDRSAQTDPQLSRKLREIEQEQIRAQLERADTRESVRDLFERWAIVDLIRRKDGGKEIRRMFEKDVLPTLGTLCVQDVTKGHITAITDLLLARGVPRMAKMIFSLMRQMFRFAQDRDIVDADPTATIRKSKIGGKETERDRVLTESEIISLKEKLPDADLLPSAECAVWITLSTCCRIGELLQTRWSDLNLEDGVWVMPKEICKNGRSHVVYLSDFSIDQFRRLRSFNSSGEWCYPNRSGTDHVCTKTISKQIGDRQHKGPPMSGRSLASDALKLAGGKWTPHDLRRTGATMMTALGVLPEVAEKCLNHTEESKVKRIYQRHSYDVEKREAWRLLGEKIALLLYGSVESPSV